MRHCTVIGLLLCTLSATPAAAGERPPADLGSAVREIFAAKCVQCHAATLARPKGKFGYVLDLPRIASNPKMVARSDPAHSKLWEVINAGDMPPDDAKAGPLADSQKLAIRAWIEAGAPAPRAALRPTAESGAVDVSMEQLVEPDPDARPASLITRLLQWIGKLHVLVVHFPIALTAAAAGLESWRIFRKSAGVSPVVRFCIFFGAAGAVVAAALGWIHAPYSGYATGAAGALRLHRWAGVAAATGAVIAAALSEADAHRGRRTLMFRVALFATALLTGAAGHLGGSLVYGDDFLHW
ncbi:MAG TPA: DUF2231 domain-containing protein [Tepidisphaeraceae bacterium]|jgi:uncharacterized membrane protein/mono/diheme cytochrome c family protein|nr:DUF2231 domain-containing protein [Tepidisphaeraceae bacterium]